MALRLVATALCDWHGRRAAPMGTAHYEHSTSGVRESAGRLVHLLPDGSGTVCLADSASLRVLDLGGTVQQTAALATPAGVVCWMPDGAWVVTGEPEQGMIRLYDAQLTLARQGSAERLLDRANLVQLFVMMPAPGAQLTAIALANDGTLAFALGGLLCVTQAAELVPQPQPRPLF